MTRRCFDTKQAQGSQDPRSSVENWIVLPLTTGKNFEAPQGRTANITVL